MTRAPVSAGCVRQRRDPYKEQTRSTRAPYCTAPPQDEKITTKQTNKGQTKTQKQKWTKLKQMRKTREKETRIRGSYHISSILGQQHFNLFISLTTKLQSLAMTVYCWHWILKYQKVLLFADQVLTYTDKHWKTFEANIWDELWDFPLSYASSPSSFWWELCCFLLSTDI